MLGKYLLLLAVGICCASAASAQTAACTCPQDFDFVVAKVEQNYSGFQDKVTAATRAAYQQHTQQMRVRAQQAGKDDCINVVREWLAFFKDRHLNVSPGTGSAITETDPVKLRALFDNTERVKLSEAEARKYLDKQKRKLDPVEGIYESQDRNYRVAIVRNATKEREFAAIILKADSIWWVPGQVKMELKKQPDGYATRFYMRDHSVQQHQAKLEGGRLNIGTLAAYNKLYPAPEKSATTQATAAKAQSTPEFGLVELSPQTLLMTIPSFDHRFKPVIDSLLRINRQKLLTHPNFIIDVRNNGGGSDISYYGLAPYLYTSPIISVSSAIWSTEDNIQKFQTIIDDASFLGDKEHLRNLVARMQAGIGTFIDRSDDTLRLDSVYASPSRVAILTNGGCASSCEQFVLAARQSKKVTQYGTNTGGVLDYANLHSLRAPCGSIALNYPTSRSKRLPQHPIDNVGIPPHVRVGEETPDLVRHVQQILEKQP